MKERYKNVLVVDLMLTRMNEKNRQRRVFIVIKKEYRFK